MCYRVNLSCKRVLSTAAAAAVLAGGLSPFASAAAVTGPGIFQPASGSGNWTAGTSWNLSGDYPAGVGASASFDTTAVSVTAARTATDTTGFKIGSVSFNNTTAFGQTVSVQNLDFDAAGSGPATITVDGTGAGIATFANVPLIFTDNVVVTVNQTTTFNGAGNLALSGAMSGTGGFTKLGNGQARMNNSGHAYEGPTLIAAGRMVFTAAGVPTKTSVFTIANGGQLTGATGVYTFGASGVNGANTVFNLNGAGNLTGPNVGNPGAIRPDSGAVTTFTNPTVLQTDTLIHNQATGGSAVGGTNTNALTFTNTISGPGKLTLTAPNSNIDTGIYVLQGTNTFTGGTLVAGGTLSITGAGATAGAGNVEVNNATAPASVARLSINSDVTNALADSATLSLAGGGAAGVADQNYALLLYTGTDTIAELTLGGVSMPAGIYGAGNYPEYFSGSGTVTVVPEPATLSLLGLSAVGLLARRRRTA